MPGAVHRSARGPLPMLARASALGALLALGVRPDEPPAVRQRPIASRPLAPTAPERPDSTSAVTQAEGLVQLGRPDAALEVLRRLSPADGRQVPVQRVRAYALLAASRLGDLRELLATSELPGVESAYLEAAAAVRARGADAAPRLAELWWTEPDSTWGLAALRELAALPGSGYTQLERDAVLATVPATGPASYLRDSASAATTLAALGRSAPEKGRLAIEIELAFGVYALNDDRLAEAAEHLEVALARGRNPELRRAVELRLGEVRRRQGEFADALRRFERVAARGDDALGAVARAAAGQMAIEQQRYRDAQRIFKNQLLDHPVGEARATALFGLGWVAFRTGSFGEARQFFATLLSEAPFGRLAPAAAYWGARCLEELGDRPRSRGELAALAARFPYDYYAYRARERVGDLEPTPAVTLPQGKPRPELAQLASFLAAGVERRARALVTRLLGSGDSLGPDELDALASAARRFGREDQAAAAERLRCERFGAAAGSPCEHVSDRFPRAVTTELADRAAAERVPAEWLVAAAYAASGLELGRAGDHGELGLFQLRRATLAELVREETRRRDVSSEEFLDAEANLRLSARYFARIARAFDGRVDYALAAFHAGPGAVTRWRQARGELPGDIFVEEIPVAPTREFVRTALAALGTYRLLQKPRPAPKLAAATTEEGRPLATRR